MITRGRTTGSETSLLLTPIHEGLGGGKENGRKGEVASHVRAQTEGIPQGEGTKRVDHKNSTKMGIWEIINTLSRREKNL